MTESLRERLRQSAASQTSENARIINAELEKLTSNIRQQLNGELASIQNDIAGTSLRISADLKSLSWASRYWWIALILTWLIGGGLSVWLSTRPAPPPVQTFESGGWSYLVPPAGSNATTCKRADQEFLCVRLPEGM